MPWFLFLVSALHFLLLISGTSGRNCMIDKIRLRRLLTDNGSVRKNREQLAEMLEKTNQLQKELEKMDVAVKNPLQLRTKGTKKKNEMSLEQLQKKVEELRKAIVPKSTTGQLAEMLEKTNQPKKMDEALKNPLPVTTKGTKISNAIPQLQFISSGYEEQRQQLTIPFAPTQASNTYNSAHNDAGSGVVSKVGFNHYHSSGRFINAYDQQPPQNAANGVFLNANDGFRYYSPTEHSFTNEYRWYSPQANNQPHKNNAGFVSSANVQSSQQQNLHH